jgi:hypothetical protein
VLVLRFAGRLCSLRLVLCLRVLPRFEVQWKVEGDSIVFRVLLVLVVEGGGTKVHVWESVFMTHIQNMQPREVRYGT